MTTITLRIHIVLRLPLPHLISSVQPPTGSARFKTHSGVRWRAYRVLTRAASRISSSSTLLRNQLRIQRSLIRSSYRCLDRSDRHPAALLALRDAEQDGQQHGPQW